MKEDLHQLKQQVQDMAAAINTIAAAQAPGGGGGSTPAPAAAAPAAKKNSWVGGVVKTFLALVVLAGLTAGGYYGREHLFTAHKFFPSLFPSLSISTAPAVKEMKNSDEPPPAARPAAVGRDLRPEFENLRKQVLELTARVAEIPGSPDSAIQAQLDDLSDRLARVEGTVAGLVASVTKPAPITPGGSISGAAPVVVSPTAAPVTTQPTAKPAVAPAAAPTPVPPPSAAKPTAAPIATSVPDLKPAIAPPPADRVVRTGRPRSDVRPPAPAVGSTSDATPAVCLTAPPRDFRLEGERTPKTKECVGRVTTDWTRPMSDQRSGRTYYPRVCCPS